MSENVSKIFSVVGSSRNRKNKKKKKSKKISKLSPNMPECKSKLLQSTESDLNVVHEKITFANDHDYENRTASVDRHAIDKFSNNSDERSPKYPSSNRTKQNKSQFSNSSFNRKPVRNVHDGRYSQERNVYNDKNCYNDVDLPHNNFTRDYHSSKDSDMLHQQIDYLSSEVNRLTQENVQLKKSLNDIQYNWSLHSTSDIDVIFKKRHLDEKYSFVLNELISNLLNGSIRVEDLNKFCSIGKCDDSDKSSEPSDECLFAVDSSADIKHNESVSSIPIYDASFDEILESPNDNKSASSNSEKKIGKNCFNCGEDHHLSKCKLRFDYRKIALAKRKLRSNFTPSVRYHAQGKNESDFKPGVISDELREALSLQKNQIPLYIYRMRILDYPPGWLCEASVESSGMILYDSEGKPLKEENYEVGETDSSAVRVQYDPDKLIDYPGFNVPLPPDMIDESYELCLPPLQTQQLRCFVQQFMAKPDVRPSRKRKIDLPNNTSSKIQRLEEDMEIEESDVGNEDATEFESDFVPPLPDSAPPLPPPPPPPPLPPPAESSDTSQDALLSKLASELLDENSCAADDSSNVKSCSDLESGTSSPSLAQLEELKKKLVMELGMGLEDSVSSEVSQSGVEESLEVEDSIELKPSEDFYILEDECVGSDESNLLSNTSDCSATQNKSDSVPENLDSLSRTTSQSKCVILGTPSLSRHSSYTKLPDYEQFSKNVSDHIPFENLPNSIGTYEKLKGVLKTVKKKFNELMK